MTDPPAARDPERGLVGRAPGKPPLAGHPERGVVGRAPGKLMLIIDYSADDITIAFSGPTIRWQGGSAPSLIGQDGRSDIVSFYYDGVKYYGAMSGDFY